jgi:UMF1 family MFS transporter
MLLAISPPEKLGEFFGVYVLTDKLSAVLGPTLVGILLTALEGYGTLNYRIAIGSLGLVIALSLFLLLRVPDSRPGSNVDEFSPEDVPDAGAYR